MDPLHRGGRRIELVLDGPPIRHDEARTSFEARIGFPQTTEHDEDATYGRFTYWDVTSGLAYEDRDPDECAGSRECRD